MDLTFISFYAYGNDVNSSERVIEWARLSGLFGYVEWPDDDTHNVHMKLVATTVHDEVVLLRSSSVQELVFVQNLPGLFQQGADSTSASFTVYDADSDVLCEFAPSSDTESLENDIEFDTEDDEAIRTVFSLSHVQEDSSLTRLGGLKVLANEVSSDIRGAVTAVPHKNGALMFARDGHDEPAAWLSHRPVVEVTSGPFPIVRWFSSAKAQTGVLGKLTQASTPRHVWVLNPRPAGSAVAEPLLACDETLVNPDFAAVLAHQAELLTEFLDEQAEERAQNIAEVHALADELGFDAEQTDRLVDVLGATDQQRSLEDVCDALQFPSYTAAALRGHYDLDDVDGVIQVTQGTFRGRLGIFPEQVERPTGNSFVDKMRRLDFDQPALGLFIILAICVAGLGLIILGANGVSFFDHLWVAVLGYAAGGWLLIDGLFSLYVWVRIRMQNRH
ncbi:hypothetical protein [Timonella sp. A28]|uniref:hypothetical protein n=1 Tax=Timonella sp. A28 TaxID=3442640 RepID=UPI003EB9A62D